MNRMKTKKRDKGTRKPTSETTKHAKKTKKPWLKFVATRGLPAGRRETTMLHVSLTPQHDAGQLDIGRIRVFVSFSTSVIENQPMIRNIHRSP